LDKITNTSDFFSVALLGWI